MILPRGARAAGLSLLFLATASALRAQVVEPPVADSLRAAEDSVDLGKRYLEGEALSRIHLPLPPRLAPDGIQPDGSLVVFDQSALEWATAESVGDLLATVPGVYLWRGGWIGRPEYASYQGRGATSVEYYLDGLPVAPLGPDSVGVDPALIPMHLLQRVEIERWAGLLRVRMYTPQYDVAAPGTSILVSTGDQSTARYGASLEKRFEGGFHYGLAADYLRAPTFDAQSSDVEQAALWVQMGYYRPGRWGLQLQYLGQWPNRDPYVSTAGDTIGAGVKGSRGETQLRAFLQGGRGTLARQLDLVLSSSGWSGDDITERINAVGLVASWRKPTFSASASGFLRSQWTTAELRGNAGWAPSRTVSASVEGAWLAYDNNRSGQWLAARAGVQLPYGFGVSGSARIGSVVAAPSLADNPEQDIQDLTGSLLWQRSWVSLQADLSSTSAFQGLAPQPYLNVPALAQTDRTTWVTVGGRIAPASWFSLESRYSNPTAGTPNGNPPTHSITAATIRSKFFRTYPSATFDLKLQVALESWGDGVIGVDSLAAPIALTGATFLRAYVQLGIGNFLFYFDRGNLLNTNQTYVPGFAIPGYGTTYGVLWRFTN